MTGIISFLWTLIAASGRCAPALSQTQDCLAADETALLQLSNTLASGRGGGGNDRHEKTLEAQPEQTQLVQPQPPQPPLAERQPVQPQLEQPQPVLPQPEQSQLVEPQPVQPQLDQTTPLQPQGVQPQLQGLALTTIAAATLPLTTTAAARLPPLSTTAAATLPVTSTTETLSTSSAVAATAGDTQPLPSVTIHEKEKKKEEVKDKVHPATNSKPEEDTQPKEHPKSGESKATSIVQPGAGAIAPFGKEDTSRELQTHASRTQDTLVDAIENAEVAEIKRSVFRALTRLRAAEIKEFDTIARLETQSIDEYNDNHHYRKENPLEYLSKDDLRVSEDKYAAFHG